MVTVSEFNCGSNTEMEENVVDMSSIMQEIMKIIKLSNIKFIIEILYINCHFINTCKRNFSFPRRIFDKCLLKFIEIVPNFQKGSSRYQL